MAKLLKYIGIIVLVVLSGKMTAQSVPVPDPVFRNFLVTNHGWLMDANQELITSNAASFTGAFYCGEQGITNLEGIQYFTNITSLLCFKNKLTTLPDISSLVNLTELQCFENQITSLPSLNNLINLQILNLGENKLQDFPEINNLQNLTDLVLYRNQLSEIPDLTNLSQLQRLLCFENRITKIGRMPASLVKISFGDNFLTQFPDISLCKGIREIGAYTNQLSHVPDLSAYTSLVHLILGTNKIQAVPESLSLMTWLEDLTLDNNLLTSIPDLSGLTLVKNCRLDNNFLTFEDLIPTSANPNFRNWLIAPQDSVSITKTVTGNVNEKFRFDFSIDAYVSQLTYSWYQNGRFRTQTNEPVLEISSLELSDKGSYYFVISSSDPRLDSINIISQTFALDVRPTFTAEKDLSITPNGDGRNDEIYFEEKGQLNIYDSRGNLLEQLSTPCIWNGTTKTGKELGTGVYIIRINDQITYEITIIR